MAAYRSPPEWPPAIACGIAALAGIAMVASGDYFGFLVTLVFGLLTCVYAGLINP